MKKQNLLFTIIFLIGINSFSQKLTCADFKTGNFYIPVSNDEVKRYNVVFKDSLNSTPQEFTMEREPGIKRYTVIRKLNTQVEWKFGLNNGEPLHEIIEWIDDCTYRLTYDNSKMELSDEDKWVNENNGIIVTKVEINENCMGYLATMTTNDGRKISQKGTICKE